MLTYVSRGASYVTAACDACGKIHSLPAQRVQANATSMQCSVKCQCGKTHSVCQIAGADDGHQPLSGQWVDPVATAAQAEQAKAKPLYCPQCGTSNAVSNRFCNRCGNRLTASSEPQSSQSRGPIDYSGSTVTYAPVRSGGEGSATASLVLGILSLLAMLTGFGAIIGVVLALIGLILGISAKKAGSGGVATAGIVLSAVGLSVTALVLLSCASIFSLFSFL